MSARPVPPIARRMLSSPSPPDPMRGTAIAHGALLPELCYPPTLPMRNARYWQSISRHPVASAWATDTECTVHEFDRPT